MQSSGRPLIIASVVILILIAAEIYTIMKFNSGMFTYTLDDPYIHLALADQIAEGHYGLNSIEASAPSSSILWPFLLAITVGLPFRFLHPLALNLLFGAGTLFLSWRILSASIHLKNKTDQLFFITFLLIVISLAINLIGIVLNGMEHTAQLFCVLLIIWGGTVYLEKKELAWWFVLALIISPLIRYENLPLSGGLILFLFSEKRFKSAFTAGGALLTLLIGFSLFLNSLDLWFLPTSVVAKTSSGESFSLWGSLIGQTQEVASNLSAILLLASLVFFGFKIFSSKDDFVAKKFGVAVGAAILAHLLFGKFGWYHRYEIYIWATSIFALIYLYRDQISNFLNQPGNPRWGLLIILISVLTLSAPYLYGLTTIPTAANNVYEQQFQMHRFVTEYYQKPIAVNDIGYVSFQNDAYVLDLWGLASTEALEARQTEQTADWMVELTDEYQVELVMIYADAFKVNVPNEWVKVGELTTSRPVIIAHNRTVDIFATNQAAAIELESLLSEFALSLPQGVQFNPIDL